MRENEGVALRAIRWSEIFPWVSIAKCFRLAATLRLMTLGAAAVLLILLGWWAIAGVFSHDGRPNSSWTREFEGQRVWQVIDRSVPNQPFAGWGLEAGGAPAQWVGEQGAGIGERGAGRELGAGRPSGLEIGLMGPMIRTWAVLTRPVWQIVRPQAPGESFSFGDFLALGLSTLWSLAVWAYFGAAISRVAAVQLATGEQVGWGAALRWAGAKWLSYFSAPLLPMVGVAVAVLPILVLGLLMKYNFFAVLAALIWPLVLAGGLVMAVLLAGVLLGWPLMWATISVEGTDSFDALNRSYAYVFQRPLRYLLYVIVAALVGWLGWFVVENLAASVIWLASWAASWGAGGQRIQDLTIGADDNSSLAHAATWLIAFWCGWVKLLAIGYSFSYFGVASTAIYYLLRRDVDARETDEVYLDADASEEKFGLPKLQKDAAGAPEIVEHAATAESTEDQSKVE